MLFPKNCVKARKSAEKYPKQVKPSVTRLFGKISKNEKGKSCRKLYFRENLANCQIMSYIQGVMKITTNFAISLYKKSEHSVWYV